MQRLLLCLVVAMLIGIADGALFAQSEDWPAWRGPEGNNHAAEDARLPLRWNLPTGENIAWKTAIPGRGHSTPIFTSEGIFLTTADEADGTQSVLKLQTSSGAILDRWVVHRATLPPRIHPNNSHASPSLAYDGELLYASFYTDDAIFLTAMTTDGRVRWKVRVCEFAPSAFQFGYGASPIIEEDLVIVAAEYDGKDSGIYGLDRKTGRQIWKVERPENLNFASPIVATLVGRRQLLIGGAERFSSYDPSSGKLIWEVETTTEAICGTVAWDGRHAFVSGGNPVAGTWCVSTDGQERLAWENTTMCYEQSLLAIKNHLFAVADNGVAYCLRASDGNVMWRERLFGGRISASPLLADKRVVVISERGEAFIFSAIPDRYELIATGKVGDSVFASPVVIGSRMYVRCGINENGRRQEYLVAIGEN